MSLGLASIAQRILIPNKMINNTATSKSISLSLVYVRKGWETSNKFPHLYYLLRHRVEMGLHIPCLLLEISDTAQN